MADDFDFNTNLMRFLAGQLHFLLSMTAAREISRRVISQSGFRRRLQLIKW
jgi:hypothetical protein